MMAQECYQFRGLGAATAAVLGSTSHFRRKWEVCSELAPCWVRTGPSAVLTDCAGQGQTQAGDGVDRLLLSENVEAQPLHSEAPFTDCAGGRVE